MSLNTRLPKKISLLGSTGSIGLNTLALVRTYPDKFKIEALAAAKNIELLYEQALEFRPKKVCVFDLDQCSLLAAKLKSEKIEVVCGEEGLLEVAAMPAVEQVIFALVGGVGLKPVIEAIRAKKQIAVANKEPLVMAGELILKEAAKYQVDILPIDSEHSGLWQCLDGRKPESVRKLILTSSGGPFRQRKSDFQTITPQEALNHPKWKMGPKITIDSATLMNKGLEVIEAANLFSISVDKIEVIIHPEAIIHAMVEFIDGTHLAQLSVTDMRLPIQYAMTYPDRYDAHLPGLDIAAIGKFHFEKPDYERFPCLGLGYEASRKGGTLPAVMNAANEIAVESFLANKIKFTEIPELIEKIMIKHRVVEHPDLAAILQADAWAREQAAAIVAETRGLCIS